MSTSVSLPPQAVTVTLPPPPSMQTMLASSFSTTVRPSLPKYSMALSMT